LQLAIDIATFEGRDIAEFFSPEYLPERTYFTAQMTRQKKWAEEKSAQLFQRIMQPRQTCHSGCQVGR
jgi:hypothetical protein